MNYHWNNQPVVIKLVQMPQIYVEIVSMKYHIMSNIDKIQEYCQ